MDQHQISTTLRPKVDTVALELRIPELETPGDGYFAQELWTELPNIHTANALSVQIHPDGKILSGAADKMLKVTCMPDEGTESASTAASPTVVLTLAAPVLTIDVNKITPDLVVVGDMAGGVTVVSLGAGAAVFTAEKHGKYVVRVAWSSCGRYFGTASYDAEARIYIAGAAADGAAPYMIAKRFKCAGQATCIAFTPPSVPVSEAEVVITSRHEHRLHLVTLDTLESRYINMNAMRDDWVSFTAMDVSFSPNGKFILVSTDKERLILFSRSTGTQLRNFYGAANDEFSTPRNCWHPSGMYIYATSQMHDVNVWEVHSGKVVTKLTGHTAPIKDIHYDAGRKVLASIGFDKSIMLWRDL